MIVLIEVEKSQDKIVLKRLNGDTFTSTSKKLNEELGDFLFNPDPSPAPDGWVPLSGLTDEHALELADIIGGNDYLSDKSKIHQCCELFCSNRLYTQQTNITGIKWYEAFKYLESKGYQIIPPKQ